MPKFCLVALLTTLLSFGCFLNSTFQTAEVTPPGKAMAGFGLSLRGGPRIELPARIGIVDNFDIGVKYGIADHVMIDGKYQALHDPIDLSVSLGFSYNTVNSGNSEFQNRTTSLGFFPMIIVGKTGTETGWYAGLRGLYLSEAGVEEFIHDKTLFRNSGWIGQGLVLGGFIHGSGVRFLSEVNFLFDGNGRRIIIPTIGFQFDTN